MAKYSIYILLFIVHFSINLVAKNNQKTIKVTSKSSFSSSPSSQFSINDIDSYQVLANFLIQSSSKSMKQSKLKSKKYSKSKSIKDYPKKQIYNVVKQLSQSQNAIKSMDGATHSLGNAFYDKSSLSARFTRFLGGRRKPKEAAKVIEYVTAVERSLQASEILQAVAMEDENVPTSTSTSSSKTSLRSSALRNAGVEEVKRFIIEEDNLNITLSLLRPIESNIDTVIIMNNKTWKSKSAARKFYSKPKKYADNEMIIAITESNHQNISIHLPNLLKCLSQPPITIALKSSGFLSEEVSIQPTILKLAFKTLRTIEDYIISSDIFPSILANTSTDSNSNKTEIQANRTLNKQSAVDIEGNGNRKVNMTHITMDSGMKFKVSKQSKAGLTLPNRLRFVGYSLGGAVASLASMLVDGSLNTFVDNDLFLASYNNRVRCISLAAPPCISRSIVPRFITSMICGDDIIPRSYYESLDSLTNRVRDALASGGGKGRFSALGVGASWIKDIAAVAGKGIQQYSTGSHDLNSLSVAGRVFYIKSRQYKQGATIQRVMRGNWREDMLWLLHEILLSKKMIKHHSLEYYIQTLSRC